MVSTVFHLNNKEATRQLKVSMNNETLPICFERKYLRVTLGRTLTYRRHLESFRKKMTLRVTYPEATCWSGWSAGATTLRTATLALVHSTATPEWCRSAHTQWRTQKIFMGGLVQGHMVVICIWCALFLTSQFDVMSIFPNQRFGKVC